MREADAIRISDDATLQHVLIDELQNGAAMGDRGRLFFESRAGATQRTLSALLELLR